MAMPTIQFILEKFIYMCLPTHILDSSVKILIRPYAMKFLSIYLIILKTKKHSLNNIHMHFIIYLHQNIKRRLLFVFHN
jgi:hypothetical protein